MIDEIAARLLQAIEQQCAEGEGRLVMVAADDLTTVELEGSFDLRGLALSVLAGLPKEAAAEDEAAPNAYVEIGEGGRLTIRLARTLKWLPG